jgi:alpha-galactosidase
VKLSKPYGAQLANITLFMICAAAISMTTARGAVTNTPAEMVLKNQWMQLNFLEGTNTPPFSFNYHGVASSGSNLFSSWSVVRSDTVLDKNRVQHTLTWTNANDPLQIKCVTVEYGDYPVVEWTVYLKNTGMFNTPIMQNIEGLDTSVSRLVSDPEFVLRGNQGDFTTADSYEPLQFTLAANSVQSFSPLANSGKSSSGPNGWPYYNLQVSGGGVIMAIGWPGQWASSFTRDSDTSLRIQAGQQFTHLLLHPGETIRTPLIALMFWQGTNTVRAQNLWRHWYLVHNIPLVNGQPPRPLAQIQISGDDTNNVNGFLQAGIHVDICWRDAGGTYTWYPSTNGPYSGDNAWLNTGTWEVDTSKYPAGFKPFSDWVHNHGMKFLLWNEPERVGNPNSWLGTNHPEWLLPPGSVGLILNEGNPDAFNWLTNHFDSLIKTQGIDWYREDMNGNGPALSWTGSDVANRQGITENFYVQGHLAFWDALLRMNPGLRIDSCASGGRRNDLETMRRAVPLTRSDFEFAYMAGVVDGNQCQTYGIASWLPFYGTGAYIYDPYSFRSFYMPLFGMGGLSPENIAAQQQAYAECSQVAPCMLNGDYYPLTPFSLADTEWMAWQFDRPDTGEGCVQAFRRTNSVTPSLTLLLQGLDPSIFYVVRDFDKGNLGWFRGNQLMTNGLMLQLAPRQSAILYYTIAKGVLVTANGDPAAGLAPLAVQFSAMGVSAIGSSVTYAWTFGDGGTSTQQNPEHTYTVGGSYMAQVTADDGLGNTSTAQVSVKVNRPKYGMKINYIGYPQTETLTNFPVLVEFGPSLATNGFSYGQVASSNGWDLFFTSADGSQALHYEMETWNTNGDSYVWVRVPQLSSNTTIWAYWGDTNQVAAPAASNTNGSVWADGFVSVWHFGETNGVSYDSTSNRTPAIVNTNHGTCVQGATGKIGLGYGFGGGYLSTSASTLPAGSNPRTVSAWFRKYVAATPSPGKELVGYGDNTNNGDRFSFWFSGNGTATALGIEDQGVARTFPWTWDGNWHHLVAVLPPGQTNLNGVILYYDGIKCQSASGSGPINTVQNELCFGAIPGYHTADTTYNLDGVLDEIRFSSVARSANWSWAEFMTTASNSTFTSYGGVIKFTPVSLINLIINGNASGVVVAWPVNTAAGSTLQESPDLIAWTNSLLVPMFGIVSNSVIVLPQNMTRFYRLAN